MSLRRQSSHPRSLSWLWFSDVSVSFQNHSSVLFVPDLIVIFFFFPQPLFTVCRSCAANSWQVQASANMSLKNHNTGLLEPVLSHRADRTRTGNLALLQCTLSEKKNQTTCAGLGILIQISNTF